MNKVKILAALVTTAGLSASLGAQAQGAGNLVDVSIYDRTQGRELPIYYHGGKYYVAGKPGNEYQITLRSKSGEGVLGVTSVDGANVITGQTATWNQSGYVLEPWATTDIKGWRKNMKSIARFYFTDLPDSYAARTDRPDDVGVIGVAVFREKPRYEHYGYEDEPRWNERERRWDQGRAAPSEGAAKAPARANAAPHSAPADSAASRYHGERAPQAQQELGTGHGERERSRARYTEFERASDRPDEVITIYYDSYQNLAAQGIVPHRRHYAYPREPRAFPGWFVPDPPRHHRW
jgi:hypothetical protein